MGGAAPESSWLADAGPTGEPIEALASIVSATGDCGMPLSPCRFRTSCVSMVKATGDRKTSSEPATDAAAGVVGLLGVGIGGMPCSLLNDEPLNTRSRLLPIVRGPIGESGSNAGASNCFTSIGGFCCWELGWGSCCCCCCATAGGSHANSALVRIRRAVSEAPDLIGRISGMQPRNVE